MQKKTQDFFFNIYTDLANVLNCIIYVLFIVNMIYSYKFVCIYSFSLSMKNKFCDLCGGSCDFNLLKYGLKKVSNFIKIKRAK